MRKITLQHPATDKRYVWIASYPKSGNTWFRTLISGFLAERLEDVTLLTGPAYKTPIASSRPAFEEALCLGSDLLTEAEIANLRPLAHQVAARDSTDDLIYAKTHDGQFVQTTGVYTHPPNVSRATIYLVRNPLDVVVSFYFYLSVKGELDRLIDRMASPEQTIGGMKFDHFVQHLHGWSGHVCSWLDQTDIPVLLIRYEDLLADTKAQFSKALHFLDLAGWDDEERLNRAVAAASFDRMRHVEEEQFPQGMWTEGDQKFFRSGTSGDWRNHLTADQAARILDAHRTVMDRLGYISDTGEPVF